MDWVSKAWADIPVKIIQQSFVLCDITADITGADNDNMFSHVPRVVAGDLDDDEDTSDGSTTDESEDDDLVDFNSFNSD